MPEYLFHTNHSHSSVYNPATQIDAEINEFSAIILAVKATGLT